MTPNPHSHPAGATGRRVLVNTGALAAGNFWRIGAAFVVQILIARRLGVAALGAYAVTLAYLNVGQVTTEAGLPALLVREVSGRPTLRRTWFVRAASIQLALALLVWALLVLIARLGASPSMAVLLLIAGASLPLYALYSAATAVFEASERMERILAAETLANSVLVVGAGTVLSMGRNVAAILWVTVLAQAAALALALLLLWRGRFFAQAQSKVSLPWRETLQRAAPFFGLALTDVLQQRSDLILLNFLAAPPVIGAYAAANSIVRIGIKLVNAYWRALYPTLARLHDTAARAFAQLDELALRLGSALALPAAALGMQAGSGILSLLFGPGYAAAVLPLALLLWTAPLYLWEQRSVILLVVARRPRGALLVAAAQLAALLISLPPLTLAWGAPGAALAGVISGLVGVLCGFWMQARAGLLLRLGGALRPGPAALVAAAAAALLPAAWLLGWPLRAAIGTFVYLLLGLLVRAFTPADLALLLRTVRPRALPPAG